MLFSVLYCDIVNIFVIFVVKLRKMLKYFVTRQKMIIFVPVIINSIKI